MDIEVHALFEFVKMFSYPVGLGLLKRADKTQNT
jgi:hypothetical protein